MIYNPELRISELGLELPPAPRPMGVYKPVLITGKYLYAKVFQEPSIATGTIKAEGVYFIKVFSNSIV